MPGVSGSDIRPVRLDVPEAEPQDLRDRLRRIRWPDELPGVGWAYGVPRAYLRELVEYWRDGCNWRAAEARLNSWPQFTTTIDDATVHFAHPRSPEPAVTPLVMTHGWPGSIVEFDAMAGPLTDPRAHGGDPADAFDLVLPTIPGFTQSGPTADTGWSTCGTAGGPGRRRRSRDKSFPRHAAAAGSLTSHPEHRHRSWQQLHPGAPTTASQIS
jgi:hypothetical protein